MTTNAEVASWMFEQLSPKGLLYQEVIVYKIKKQFGDEFVYINVNGNLAISKEVLAEFRKLTQSNVVWDRGERAWRMRNPNDDPTRRQVGE